MTKTAVKVKKDKTFWERNRDSGGYLLKKKISDIAYRIIRVFLLFGMCFLILQPILNKISISFMAEEDLYNAMVIAVPEHFTTDNYQLATQFMDYGKTFLNTLLVSLSIAVLQIAVCTLVGYGFARFEFPLKKFWFACVVLMIIIPPQTLSTSLYLHFQYFDILGIIKLLTGSALNLRGSALPYYLMSIGCMGLKNGLYIFMIRQFFRNIPKELEEAATIDGASLFQIYQNIYLPLSKPILSTVVIMTAYYGWNEFMFAAIFVDSSKLRTIPVGLMTFRDGLMTEWGVVLAGMVIACVPIMTLFC